MHRKYTGPQGGSESIPARYAHSNWQHKFMKSSSACPENQMHRATVFPWTFFSLPVFEHKTGSEILDVITDSGTCLAFMPGTSGKTSMPYRAIWVAP